MTRTVSRYFLLLAILSSLTAGSRDATAETIIPLAPTPFDSLDGECDVAPWPASDSLVMPDLRECPRCYQIIPSKVDVYALVSSNGRVDSCIAMARPSGLGFEDPVVRIVTQWRFMPAHRNDLAVDCWIPITFRFKGTEHGLDSTQFVKCQRYAKVGVQPHPLTLYQPPVIVLCPH